MRTVPEAPPYNPDPGLKLEIVYQDDALLAVNKPSGLLSVPGKGDARQTSALSLLQADHGWLGVVHRLDMDTSGLLIFARTTEMMKALSRAFAESAVDKRYIAWVEGEPDGDSGQIDLPIGRDWDARPLRKIDRVSGKPSSTIWHKLEVSSGKTRLELEPLTGRTHQLRLHCAAIGHPILGDRLYGNPATAQRLCLHALSLRLTHPATGNQLHLKAELTFSAD
ncbi:RluA family pseudouridine synthase [Henriciella sp. AS95]|uniref:RluA family pseudouridine synthase n=1 Tax=Henriciella sp. AS95 TaxID=3135782 RepID=UPI00317F228F